MDNGEAYWIKWFNEQKFTTIIVPGNHENWHRLREYPLMTKFGGRVRQISDSIFMAERPSVLNIEGKSIFCFGGAESHDKAWRTEGLSWWPEEVQSHAEQELALDILAEHDYKFDYVFTHTCPTEVVEMIISHKANCSTSRFLSHIRANIEYDEWHFGHMHEDVTLGKFHCHYNGKPEQII
jgi:DNA repair exonuclease SbcCD nuclease subunit